MPGEVCYTVKMAIKLDLDRALVEEAVAVGGRRTKKEAVVEGLREYIARRRQTGVTRIFGTVDYDPNYDYKEQRRGR
jgi:hypothetical protein